MAVELLLIGSPTALTQNLTYALPSVACLIHVKGSGMEMSDDNSNWDAVTLDTSEQFQAAAGFVRSTAASTIITVKAL